MPCSTDICQLLGRTNKDGVSTAVPLRPTGQSIATLCAAALDAAHRPIVLTDDHSVHFANSAACSLFRAEQRSDLVGIELDRLLHPDVRETASQRREIIYGTGRPLEHLPTKFVALDGSIITAAAVGRLLTFGESRALMFEMGDGKLHSPATTDSEPHRRATLCEAAVEALPDAIMMHDTVAVLFANHAMRAMLHASAPAQVEGELISAFVHPDSASASAERRELLTQRGWKLDDVPLKLVATDGSPVYARADGFAIQLEAGPAIVISARGASR